MDETTDPKRGKRTPATATAEPQPKGDFDTKAAALLDDGPEAEVEIEIERTPCDGVFVVAMHDGTYPDRGETYGVYRKQGDVFELNYLEDYASYRQGGWMRRVKQGEQITPEQAPQRPQTAQRGQRAQRGPRPAITNPFPPMS